MTFLPRPVSVWVRDQRLAQQWRLAGRPVPAPDRLKQRLVLATAKKFQCRWFIETGTYLGDMVAAAEPHFECVVSIELDRKLFEDAQLRFFGHPKIKLYQGDSTNILPTVVPNITERTCFWLDGHYSGGTTAKGLKETPIMQELAAIATSPDRGHVILIDDARLFVGQHDYPAIDDLQDFVHQLFPLHEMKVVTDIIHLTPRA